MKNRSRLVGLIIVCSLLSLGLYAPVNAEGNDTVLKVVIFTDGNVTGYFNATAGGDVNYWIEDIEVKTEFENIWKALGEFVSVWNALSDIEDDVHNAQKTASVAMATANDNLLKILENNESITDIYDKLMVLLDELLGFEQEYLLFKDSMLIFQNNTNDNISDINDLCELLKQRVTDLENQVNSIKNDLDKVEAGILFSGKLAIGFLILACGLYLINRRYPIGVMVKNGRVTLSDGSRRFIDLVKNADKSKKVKNSKSLRYKITHIRVNKNKSPIRIVLSRMHIHK